MKHPFIKTFVAASAIAMLAACGDDSTPNNPQTPAMGQGSVVENPILNSSASTPENNSMCAGLTLTADAWILSLGDASLILNGDGTVADEGGNIIAYHDGGMVLALDGNVIVDGVDYSSLPVCPATVKVDSVTGELTPISSSSAPVVTPAVSSSSVVPGTDPEVPGTDPAVPGSSASVPGTEPMVSSSSVEPVTPSGNPEEDIKKYPVPTLKNILGNGNNGWNTRYWDACKPHCSWAEAGKDDRPDITSQANYEKTLTSARNCNINDVEIPTFTYSKGLERYWIGYEGTPSACEIGEGGSFTCTDMAPVAVNDTLAYAFVAGNPSITTCGKCFHLQYDGSFADAGASNAPKETHKALKGKHIIVMASNIGHDVKVGQFDLMVPGGGPGIFNALNLMVNRSDIEWGAQYGGFLTYCQQQLGYDKGLKDYQTCIKDMCDAAFADAGRPNLLRGCHWFADWFMAADNPTYQYEEIECPQYLVDKYMTTLSTTIDTKVLYQSDWSSYNGGELITTDACSPTPNGTGEYCDPDQLAADKAKKY